MKGRKTKFQDIVLANLRVDRRYQREATYGARYPFLATGGGPQRLQPGYSLAGD